MNSNIVNKVNNAFDFAVKCFLLVGSLSVLFYSMQSRKLIYILLSIFIYCLSYLLRNKLFKVKSKSGFTEVGLFFISILFLGYLLNLLNIDRGIRNYFPDKILVGSGISFIFIIIISLLSNFGQNKLKFINIIILITVLLLLQTNQEFINSFFQNNPRISEFVIGAPVVYLGLLLAGLNKSSQET